MIKNRCFLYSSLFAATLLCYAASPSPKHLFFLFEFEKDGSGDVGLISVFEHVPDIILQSKSYILNWPNPAVVGRERKKHVKYAAKVIMSGG